MDEQKKHRLLKEIETGIKDNKSSISKVIDEEVENGNIVYYEKILSIVQSYNTLFQENLIHEENKKIAIICSGNPEITLEYFLDAIIYSNHIILVSSGYKLINEVLFSIIKESMNDLKIENDVIDYDAEYTEKYVKDNQNKLDKIIYIGDYFEYKSFNHMIKVPVEYNNFGYIKLYIDKSSKQEEYKKIMKFAYIKNIYVDVYDDLNEFIMDSNKDDFGVAYIDGDGERKLKEDGKFETLLINEFPYEKYEFTLKK